MAGEDMIPHSWILKWILVLHQIYSINEKGNGEMECRSGGWESEIGKCLPPVLFVLALILLTISLRKMKTGYQFGTQRSSINHLLFTDDLKLYAKDEKQLDTLVNTVQYSAWI